MKWVDVKTIGNQYFTVKKRCNLNSIDFHINVNEEKMRRTSDYDGWCEFNTSLLKTKYQHLLHGYYTIYRNTFTDWLGLTTFEGRYKKLMNEINEFCKEVYYEIVKKGVEVRIRCAETNKWDKI